ncbi:polysaccharide pyruvyl transferase family protein [Motiliproteus coralliicola]|uniref:Polysaccharide pyruvyl transferase family protein n=1 Tax=Motiliproteus coralliicola TaxID=2283196 RepID=A0A369WUK5_9GAMM|nr:polysaccharide pyruvyl transferase family protein [Motiliproteus coralliicola]RDE24813.1 polysaccharide pyruvyl transferase family protein [Motiliproteus coralliicola]
MKKAVLINDTTYDYHHGCEAVVSGIKSSLLVRGVEVIASCPVGVHYKKMNNIEKAIQQSDLIVVNGEGTIHHGREKAKWLLEVSAYAKKYNTPSVLINATYQDNPAEFDKLLNDFDLVYVRESESYDYLKQRGIEAGFAPDLTMLLSQTISLPEYQSRNGIGITDSPKVQEGMWNFQMAMKHGWTFLPVLRSYRAEGEKSATEVLRHLKHLFTNIGWINKENGVSEESYLRARNRFLCYTVSEYLKKVSGLQILLASRFHSLCFAIVTETPFLATSGNSYKVEGLLRDVGLSSRICELSDFDDIADYNAYSFSDEEKIKIKEYKKSSLIKINNMFDKLVGLTG